MERDGREFFGAEAGDVSLPCAGSDMRPNVLETDKKSKVPILNCWASRELVHRIRRDSIDSCAYTLRPEVTHCLWY